MLGPGGRNVLARAALLALAASCATEGDSGGGGDNLPNAAAGPFRKSVIGELGNSRSAPIALDDSRQFPRDPAVVDLDGDPSTLGAAGFFGWYENPKIEQLTQDWLDATDDDARMKIAAAIQVENYTQAPTITLGQFQIPTAYRKNLAGILDFTGPLFWNVRRV